MNKFIQSIRTSLALRERIAVPRIRWIVLLAVLFLIAYIGVCLKIAPQKDLTYHFDKESGAITILSGIMLSMTAGFAALAFFLLLSYKRNFSMFFWLLAAVGFGFFALDELLEFHGSIGDLIDETFIGPVRHFRNWNDVIVIFYGVAGLAVILAFLPEILRYPKFTGMLATAFAFYVLTTLIDSTQKRSTISIIVEESTKLFSSTFFALAMFAGVLGVFSYLRAEASKEQLQ